MSNVISINKNKHPDASEGVMSPNRKPLYVRNKDGSVSGSPHMKGKSEDFGDRVSRIRASLDRINILMGELKKMSAQAQKDHPK